MKVISSINEMRTWSKTQHDENQIVGLVPTMGYLHEGHLSLIREAKKHADRIVVSIYVNPTQFAPGEDLDRYPRDFDRDEKLCYNEGVATIFFPDSHKMYRPDHKTFVITDDISKKMCGLSRPTHFKGVTTVVAKLFNIVNPDYAVFGQKDAQQAFIIQKMVEDLNMNVNIIVAPTIREADGLAMSSRNKYLSDKDRSQASVLFRSLEVAKSELLAGNSDNAGIKEKMRRLIEEKSDGRIDYIEIVDAGSLEETAGFRSDKLIALAVYFDQTRLIDNFIIKYRQ